MASEGGIRAGSVGGVQVGGFPPFWVTRRPARCRWHALFAVWCSPVRYFLPGCVAVTVGWGLVRYIPSGIAPSRYARAGIVTSQLGPRGLGGFRPGTSQGCPGNVGSRAGEA